MQDSPKPIDVPTRNENVYKTLQALGLCVIPVQKEGQIKYFLVSTGMINTNEIFSSKSTLQYHP